MRETPELDKLAKAAKFSQQQGDFLAWLIEEKGYVLAEYLPSSDRLYPASFRIPELLAEYHGVDLARVEEERRQLL